MKGEIQDKLPEWNVVVGTREAVELVKKYGAEDDYQFVNGLLGVVARERGETPEPQC